MTPYPPRLQAPELHLVRHHLPVAAPCLAFHPSPMRDRHAELCCQPRRYVQVVEFPSYEQATAKSAAPETTAFAQKLSAPCVSEPTFRNPDVVRVDEL